MTLISGGGVTDIPIRNAWQTMPELPAKTELSEVINTDLKKRVFSFVGPTIVYAFMQTVDLVDDHTVDWFRYHEITALSKSLPTHTNPIKTSGTNTSLQVSIHVQQLSGTTDCRDQGLFKSSSKALREQDCI